MARPTPPPPENQTTTPKLRFDWRDWDTYLSDLDLSEADGRQIFEILWLFMTVFVDDSWDCADPQETSGQVTDVAAALHAVVLDSEKTPELAKEAP